MARAVCAYTPTKRGRGFGGGCHGDPAFGCAMDLRVLRGGRAAPARLVGSPREETLRLFLADILQLCDEDFFDGCGQLRDRRALEETAQGDGGLKVLPQTGEHLSSEQRVAA